MSLVLIGLCVCAHAQEAKPYLQIETGAHTAKVNRIDVDAAEQLLVSASDDKTARVWDLKSGKLLKILRPPIGDFKEGMLYAIAISPDGKSIAVGGYTGPQDIPKQPIYIFDRDSGEIRKTTKDLPDVTSHLAYSRDGRYLFAALHSNYGICVFETGAYSEIGCDSDYDADSYWIEFDASGRMVTTSMDGYVRLYSSDLHLLKKVQPSGGRLPYSARFSPNGDLVAVGFLETVTVDVLSAKDLSFQYKLQPPQNEWGLPYVAWSTDGQNLCAGGRYLVNGVSPVLCWDHAGKGKLSTFPVAANGLMDMRALRDGGISFAVGDGTVGVLGPKGVIRWRVAPDTLDYPRLGERSFLRLSSDGNTVEVVSSLFNGTSYTTHVISFSNLDQRLEVDSESKSLRGPATSGLAVDGWRDRTKPTLDGSVLPLGELEISRSLAISANKDSFVIGTEWYVYRFGRDGKRIWRTAAPDAAWGVNMSADGRFVVAALGDGTVRWYTCDKGEEVLALFVDRDLKRWVAWSPDGFFTFAGGGDALIGYQINRGPGQAGDFVRVDQLREVFYRPDLVSQILKPGGVEAVLAERRRISGDLSKPLVDKVLSGGPLPEIELLSPAEAEVNGEYRLEFRVKNATADANNIVVRYDGAVIPLNARGDFDILGSADNKIVRNIPVRSGRHDVTISAKANGVEGPSRSIRLKGPDLALSSNLYVVAAGISHYPDPAMNKGVSFAAADADYITAAFKKQEGKGLFQKVVPSPVPLLDSRATVKNISDAVANVVAHIQPGDTFVLYLAGHGVAVHGDYYFIPWVEKYTSSQDLLNQSLTRAAIQNLLGQVKLHTQKIILILDTCGASAVMGGADAEKESDAMSRVGTLSGYPVLAASSTDAVEGYENHGVFTFFLVEGMYKADPDGQGDILTTRLGEYTQKQVPKIAEQKLQASQKPVTHFEGEPFPLAHKVTN